MGILDMLLKLDARRQGAVLDDQEARVRRQQTEQGVGLAQALAGVGKGPQAPVKQPDGRFKTPMDPDAAAAVRLMQNPGSRGIGNQNAINVMDPAWQQQQAQGQASLDSAKLADQSTRYANLLKGVEEKRRQETQANDVANADRNYALDQRRTAVYEGAQRAAMQASQAQARQVGLFGGLDQKEWLDRGEKTRAVAQAVGAGRGMVKILQEYGNVGKIASPEARAALEVGMFSLIPALQASINAGGQNALGTEERDYLQAFMGNPQEFVLRPEVTIAKLSGIVKKLENDLDYRSSTMPYLPSQAFIVPSYDLPPGLVPLSMQQQGPGFYEQIGSGAINPGYGIPR
jgi:hypothetical protein